MQEIKYLDLASVLSTFGDIKVKIYNSKGFICYRFDSYYTEHQNELYKMDVVYVAVYNDNVKILLREV